MQQVMYANGKIWGALDTAINPDNSGQRAGVAWFILKPDTSTGSLVSKIALQGYLGAAGSDFTYPAIGVTPSGRGVMAFTYTGDTAYPSAAYAPIDALTGVGAWAVVPGGAGQAADDGFGSYKAQVGNPPRTRWGDYGAAAVDGNHVWIASEYIAHACDYTTWGGPFFTGGTGDNLLGTCAGASHGPGTRTALANWRRSLRWPPLSFAEISFPADRTRCGVITSHEGQGDRCRGDRPDQRAAAGRGRPCRRGGRGGRR
jgi:hypothetical protein